MLVFEVRDDKVHIICDQKGMDTIICALENIRASGDHIHLWSPSYGGCDLEDRNPWGEPAVKEVVLDWYQE